MNEFKVQKKEKRKVHFSIIYRLAFALVACVCWCSYSSHLKSYWTQWNSWINAYDSAAYIIFAQILWKPLMVYTREQLFTRHSTKSHHKRLLKMHWNQPRQMLNVNRGIKYCLHLDNKWIVLTAEPCFMFMFIYFSRQLIKRYTFIALAKHGFTLFVLKTI